MTNPLRDALDDLVCRVPDHVGNPDLASQAQAAGRTRRIRRRLATSAAAVVVTVLIAALMVPTVTTLQSLPPAGSDTDSPGVTEYPQRIGHQWRVRDLPDKPGPMAGLVDFRNGGWEVISSTGQRWSLPDDVYGGEPTISPNGRYVGYLTHRTGPYVVHDLVTGERREFPEIASHSASDEDAPYRLHTQIPSFWTPDNQYVAIYLLNAGWVKLGTDGSMVDIKPQGIPGELVGWASSTELASVVAGHADPDDFESPIVEMHVTIATPDGRHLRRVPLSPRGPWNTERLDQWSAVVSPDGTKIVVQAQEEAGGSPSVIHQFDLATGEEIASPVTVDRSSACPFGWAGEKPTAPTHDGNDNYGVPVIADDDAKPQLVVVEPGLQTSCMIWASDALAGGPRDGVLDLATGWWTWWWREIAAGLLTVVAAAAVVIAVMRRRRGVTYQ